MPEKIKKFSTLFFCISAGIAFLLLTISILLPSTNAIGHPKNLPDSREFATVQFAISGIKKLWLAWLLAFVSH